MDLPGALLLWAMEHQLADHAPVFFSRKRASDGAPRAISRHQAWEIVRAASERADVRALALRATRHGQQGELARVCARSSGKEGACRSPRSRLAGRACKRST
jgi:hypothetical protein